jgi:outer membrane biosynthesis protein TonB
MRKELLSIVAIGVFLVLADAIDIRAQQAEPEFVIVKYGKVIVQSPVPEARVFVDDEYRGPADTTIENIIVGMHTISCRTATQTASGAFAFKKDETLKLEAHYQDGKLLPVVEREKIEKVEKVEPEKKPKLEAPKPEKPKKPVVVAVKKEEKKDPAEERRELHLNMIKIFFEDIDSQDVRVSHKANPKVISKFAEKKHQAGTYYRTKKNVLLCDAGPCEQQWSASFAYTDDTGKADTIGLTWKQTVFNGITPTGTSKRELLYCLNGSCKTLEDTAVTDNAPVTAEAGRYHLTWSKASLIIRRSDIMKEIIDTGGSVEAY